MLNYVVYKLILPDGRYYIGKTNNIERRILEHRKCKIKNINIKNNAILENGGFNVEILYSAPENLDKHSSQLCIDNMERLLIHKHAKMIYENLTGENSNFIDYTPYKQIINEKLLNTKIY